MDATEKIGRKLRRSVFRIAEEVSRIFKADVSVQPSADTDANGSWVLGIVGIGTILITPNESVAAASVITAAKGKRRGKRRTRRAAGKRKHGGNSGVESSGKSDSSN